MAKSQSKLPRPHEEAGTGAETTPPGATRQAEHRPLNPRRKGPNDDAKTERTIDDPDVEDKAE